MCKLKAGNVYCSGYSSSRLFHPHKRWAELPVEPLSLTQNIFIQNLPDVQPEQMMELHRTEEDNYTSSINVERCSFKAFSFLFLRQRCWKGVHPSAWNQISRAGLGWCVITWKEKRRAENSLSRGRERQCGQKSFSNPSGMNETIW